MARAVRKPAPATAELCCVKDCPGDMLGRCSWKMHELREIDGAEKRVYNGTTCDLKLCAKHGVPAGDGVLCAWHASKAREQGLVK